MSEIKAKLNEVIKCVVGEKKPRTYNEIEVGDVYASGYNSAKSEIAEREVEVDVEVIMKVADEHCYNCRAYSDRRLCGVIKGEICKDIAKVIAEQILAGNVLKVKEQPNERIPM